MGLKKTKNKGSKRFTRKLKHILKNPFTYLELIIVVCVIAATIIVEKTETVHPEGEIGGYFDAVWHTVVAIVAAYYDFYMKTVPGRLASLVLLLLGMAIWTVIMGKITSSIMEVQTEKNKGLRKLRKMKEHFIICGWRPGFDKILDNLMQSNPQLTPDMIVIVNNAPSENIEQLRADMRFSGVKYVSGDFSDAATLKRAYVETADRVLVISDYSREQSDMEIDSRTVLAVLTIKNLNPKLYTIAEILDEKFKEHLSLARCDRILLTKEYQRSLLATASSGMGYSNVIKTLMTYDADSGIVVEEIPASYEGKQFADLHKLYSGQENVVLVGLLLNAPSKKQKQKMENIKPEEPVLSPSDDYVIPKFAKAILVKSKDTVA